MLILLFNYNVQYFFCDNDYFVCVRTEQQKVLVDIILLL